jgi:hypothetical protein
MVPLLTMRGLRSKDTEGRKTGVLLSAARSREFGDWDLLV